MTPRMMTIKIGMWVDRDGTRYRAAYINDCVLTGPEHAELSDEELLQEARREAKRADGLIGRQEATT